ncbi:hypothetical protein EON65_33190 [archaeon]|nr:MAG: hypothetical protein EON65_33190 [archaeon]
MGESGGMAIAAVVLTPLLFALFLLCYRARKVLKRVSMVKIELVQPSCKSPLPVRVSTRVPPTNPTIPSTSTLCHIPYPTHLNQI